LNEAGIPEDKAPWVWLATCRDAVAKPAVLPLAMLFQSLFVPKFGFSIAEQGVLNLALEGFADEAIGQTMGASLSTIKKRFRGIYEKVQDKIGDLTEDPSSLFVGTPVTTQVIFQLPIFRVLTNVNPARRLSVRICGLARRLMFVARDF
jgi:hypothetical protein